MPRKAHRVEAFLLSVWGLCGGLLAWPARAHPTGAPAPNAPDFVLWNQTDGGSGARVVSQDFEPAQDAFDCEGVDDFVVPSGTAWGLQTVVVQGTYTGGSGPPSSVDLVVYSDSAGLPDVPVCSYPTQSPDISVADFTFHLPFPCMLQPGHYWMSVQANLDSAGGKIGRAHV